VAEISHWQSCARGRSTARAQGTGPDNARRTPSSVAVRARIFRCEDGALSVTATWGARGGAVPDLGGAR
jgi:hypothetical protein